jgi:hypothetical protein
MVHASGGEGEEQQQQPTVRLLRQELNSWIGFIDALRGDDRAVAHEMMERCTRYVEAIEQSGKFYLTEPFFLSILLDQARQIRAFEVEMQRVREEVEVWKKGRPDQAASSSAGSPPAPGPPPGARTRLG